MKILSIYILNFNYGKYLEQCLESVLLCAREYRDLLEIVLIDDNSSDNSKLIIDNYKNRLDFIYINRSNIGLIKSCNFIIKKLSGQYILRIDADDYVEPNFVKYYLMEINDNSPDIIYSDYNLVNDFGKIISAYQKSNKSNDLQFDKSFHGAFTAIKKHFLDEINNYDEEFTRQDGYYIWIQAKINKKYIKHINKTLWNYRQHRSSLSFNKRNLLDTRYDINRKYLSRFVDFSTIKVIIPVENDYLFSDRIDLVNKFLTLPIHFTILISKEALKSSEIKINVNQNICIREDDNLTYIDDINFYLKKNKIEEFLIVEPNYPKLNLKSILDVLLVAKFNSYDICFSAFIDTNSYLINDGLDLKPFNHTSRIRYERNELYRIAGGIKFFRNQVIFNSYNFDLKSDIRIGHSEIDEISAIRIQHINNILNE
jgi:glycosyltransferase involved in cell wall biosynthesis